MSIALVALITITIITVKSAIDSKKKSNNNQFTMNEQRGPGGTERNTGGGIQGVF